LRKTIEIIGKIFCTDQCGDTLVEVMVSMILLGLMIVWVVPLFSILHADEVISTAKVGAYNLAESQIEAIRSAPFVSTETGNVWYGMGTIAPDGTYGDPPGQFPQFPPVTPDVTRPGITYHMYTQIRWKPDPSNTTVVAGEPVTDYKNIAVEVKAQIAGVNPTLCPDIVLNSIVTEEYAGGEVPAIKVNGTWLPSASIYVEAVNTNNGSPVGNITVKLTGSIAGATYEMVTDSATGDLPGGVLFANLPADTYTMQATDTPGIGPVGWVVATSGSKSGHQTTTLAAYATTNLVFNVTPAS
jgi:hypothetical protein